MLNLNTDLLIGILRIVALVTILFVWVIRYDNIKNEFKEIVDSLYCVFRFNSVRNIKKINGHDAR